MFKYQIVIKSSEVTNGFLGLIFAFLWAKMVVIREKWLPLQPSKPTIYETNRLFLSGPDGHECVRQQDPASTR